MRTEIQGRRRRLQKKRSKTVAGDNRARSKSRCVDVVVVVVFFRSKATRRENTGEGVVGKDTVSNDTRLPLMGCSEQVGRLTRSVLLRSTNDGDEEPESGLLLRLMLRQRDRGCIQQIFRRWRRRC